ncbi:MAG: hypothetical protein GKS06_14615 [Acidobacteria bacterium]|nr:hypothetical protein [Acidobacteriota bacterium]
MPTLPGRYIWVLAGCVAAGLVARPLALAHIPITTTVEFNREVIRILERRCLSCHGNTGAAMSLATYDEARPWAEAIKEEVLARRMPPWRPVRGYGHFLNDNSLSDHELAYLVSWAEGGAPEGATAAARASAVHDDHRLAGDAVLNAEAVEVPAYSSPFERMLLIDPETTEDRWFDRIQWDPGDPSVVESAFVFVEPSGQWVGTWLPWSEHAVRPIGTGYFLPAGSTMRVEVRYRGGEDDRVDAGALVLDFAEEPPIPMRQLEIAGALGPAGGAGLWRGELMLAESVRIFALRPEISEGAESLEIRALLPDGASRVLLWMLADRADSQAGYVLAEPLILPAGTRLILAVHHVGAPPAGVPRVLVSAY